MKSQVKNNIFRKDGHVLKFGQKVTQFWEFGGTQNVSLFGYLLYLRN